MADATPTPPSGTKPKAFTLIELLIVVAIIAILAAIAVPNFLEAMTRAKVSRTKADMRSVATAIETYRVDNNRYPPDAQFGVIPFVQRLRFLTTPISYISSIPPDPFADEGRIRAYVQDKGENGYSVDGTVNGDMAYPLTYDYASRIQPGSDLEGPAVWINITRNLNTVLWAMRSAGPDLEPNYLGDYVPSYDPTNGTVSRGNIYWTGPGIGFDDTRF